LPLAKKMTFIRNLYLAYFIYGSWFLFLAMRDLFWLLFSFFKKQFTLFLLLVACSAAHSQPVEKTKTWEETRQNGTGTLTVYWYESKPFIYRNGKELLEGVEYDLVEGFKKYVKDRYQVNLTINWIETNSFGDTYQTVRKSEVPCLGASAFSITPERELEVGFAPPYMADISVMISSQNIPATESIADFNRVYSGLTAITIEGTTYEQDLLRLQKETGVPFTIRHIPSHQNILHAIESQDNAFGFIDLPVYMMMFSADPSIKVKRQNHYPVKRRGYSIIYPKGSDWGAPIAAYTESIRPDFEKLIDPYIDLELYRFVEELAEQSDDELELLNKEKELQYLDLLNKSNQLEQQTRTSQYLIGLITVVLTFLLIIIFMYRKRNEQKNKIQAQQKNIELKNQQLEKRNEHLVSLDEEKNNLIKILAHDLRTPINHVQGLAQVFLLSNPQLPEDQKSIIQNIMDASVRLNKMISNILDIDAVENNRIKIIAENVRIYPLLQKVTKSFDKVAGKKNIELSLTADGTDCTVHGDSLFLIQIFENLVSNAIKFSEKEKKVEVKLIEKNEKIWICIVDQGPGLSDEDQQLLFKKFQRLSTHPTDGEKSTGLGLSIVKKYVELMGGQVWCESEQGKGAAFIVEFSRI
jgi:signal transduction histidine kinase